MVNHVRTLLLNLPPWLGTDAPAGEEYVPYDYVTRRLTPVLVRARTALFGTGADRAGMNITLARVVAYVHASQFFRDMTADDPRITYDPTRPARVFDTIGPVVAGPPIVGWAGTSSFDTSGRGGGSWTVTTDVSGNYVVTPGGGAPALGTVIPGDSGDIIPLAGSGLSLVVPTGDAATWTVTLTVPPSHSFVLMAELTNVSSLFRPSAGGSESAWYRAWSGNGPPSLRAAAAVMALAARTDELGV